MGQVIQPVSDITLSLSAGSVATEEPRGPLESSRPGRNIATPVEHSRHAQQM